MERCRLGHFQHDQRSGRLMPNLHGRPFAHDRPSDHKMWTYLLLALHLVVPGLQSRRHAVLEALSSLQRVHLQKLTQKCTDSLKSILQGRQSHEVSPHGTLQGEYSRQG